MLTKIIGFSLKNKLIIGLFTLALVIFGAYETTKLPIDAVPDITDNQVQIITVAPSFGASDIERLITFPVEQANSNIKGLKEIRSFSRFGLSVVTIVFDDKTDVYWARQQVSERLLQIQNQIPKEIGTPELGPITTGLGEIYQYVVRPKKGYENRYDAIELRTIQDWIVRRQLLGVKGVAEVGSFGGKLKQFEITINQYKLESLQITIDDVFEALEKNNQNTGGAYIDKGPTVLFIRSEGLIGSQKDIENIPVKTTPNGTPILIKDVADVTIGFATRYGAMCYNDEGEVTGAIVMMLKGANSSEVIKNVKERIAQIQKTLPEGVIIEPFLDRTKMVNNAISTVETNLMEGALIVVFILVLFLGNLRAGFLVASVIPLAMLFAIILMNLFGVSGNLMSLGALDFGLIVDGAVIIVEAVMHQISHGKAFRNINRFSQTEMDEQVGLSAGKMMNSAVFGQIIILIVYLPILTLQGIEGKMFIPMAQTVAFALIGAFILSLTYIPMMSSLVLSKKIKHKPNFSDRIMSRIEKRYQSALTRVMKYPKTLLGIVGLFFIASIITLSGLGGEFIPALEEGDFAVEARVLTGSNLNTSIEYTQKACKVLLKEFPEIEKIITKTGSGEVPTDPMPMEASDMMIILKDKSEWTSAESFPELADKMSKVLEKVPGLTTGFQYPVQMRFNELMTGARQDVVCKIFGEDLDTLAKYASKLGAIINTVDGTKDLYIESVTGLPQVVIKFNREAIAQYRLNIADINRIINTAFAGQSAGLVYEGEKRFDLIVRLDHQLRSNLADVQDLLIPTPGGQQVPLDQLAEVEIKDGPNQIQREDAKRRIIIGFNVGDRDVQSIVEELQRKVEAKIDFPAAYYVTYGGSFENLKEAKDRLLIAVPVSLALIFLLLFFAFKSIKHSLLIYTAIPLSAMGGIFFLALRGMPFSISAGVGFIALFGVAVLNGIVLIAEFNRLKKAGLENLSRIVITGAKTRLRPVLMTAFVASLGFLPMAMSNGAGAEVQRPLATVVIGGLMLATLLTLFVIPILYTLFEKMGKPKLPGKKTALLVGLALLSGNALQAQLQPITLQAALDSAMKNNLSIKNQELYTSYKQKLISSAIDIPQATLSGEAGQLNSRYIDTRFGFSQSFSNPRVYASQKRVLTAEWLAASITQELSKAETQRMVRELFFQLLLLRKKEQILVETDSLYAVFLEKATLRYKSGETSILEKTSAESQRSSILIQLKQLRTAIELAVLELQLVVHTQNPVEPQSNSLRYDPPNIQNGEATKDFLLLEFYDQQIQLAEAAMKLEKSKFLPEITVGYSNQSMRGVGADNIYYNPFTRFNGFQIALGIPLFYGAQKAKIAASKVQLELNENQFRLKELELEQQLLSALSQYKQHLEIVEYFESTLLPDAEIITQTAAKQYAGGEINYLEWAMLNAQALQLQTDYLDAVNQLNTNSIQLIFLTSK